MLQDHLERLTTAVAHLPDKTPPDPEWMETDDFSRRALRRFGRTSSLGSAFVMHTGKRLAKTFGPVLAELAGNVWLPLGEPWGEQWDEIARVTGRFLWETGGEPALLWAHTLCLSDEFLLRRHRADFVSPKPSIRSGPVGCRVKLSYSPRHYVEIDTGKICWLPPPGLSTYECRMARVAETRETVRGGVLVSAGSRESLGACGDVRYDRPWLSRRLFPGHRGRVYAARGLSDTEIVRAWVGETPRVTDPDGRFPGVIDVLLLRAWRMTWVGVGRGRKMAMVDELVFALAPSGEVAYISATRDGVDRYFLAGHEDNWLTDWLDIHS